MSVVGGVPADVRAAWPVLPKLLIAITFPIGIVFILLFGGELFTGKCVVFFGCCDFFFLLSGPSHH